jgi:hypothetical protein
MRSKPSLRTQPSRALVRQPSLRILLVPAAVLGAVALGQAPAEPQDRDAFDAPVQAVLAASEVTAPASQPSRPAGPRPHRLAVVRAGLSLARRPGGRTAIPLETTTEFGSRRVLSVAARRGGWLGVVTSERPNNRLAWVRRDNPSLTMRRTHFSLHADLSDRTLTLRRGRRRVHRLKVAVGRPGAATPTGRFAVTDKLSGSSYSSYYGCCVLALNGHQPNPPPGWTGGSRLAIHGTNDPSSIGAAASAGCLRAADANLRVLMAKVPLGTPVFIRR